MAHPMRIRHMDRIPMLTARRIIRIRTIGVPVSDSMSVPGFIIGADITDTFVVKDSSRRVE